MHAGTKRANEIDLLRFIAALAVVVFHYGFHARAASGADTLYPQLSAAAKYGYLGVDLFFLISGFVIMMSASQGSVRAFVASRAARLYPAFVVCCTATFVVLLLAGSARVSVGQYLLNVTLLGLFAAQSLVDGSYWSLLAELRFYFLVALLLFANQLRNAEHFLALWLAVALVMLVHPVKAIEVLLVTNWAAYFIAGATFYFVWAQGLTRRRSLVLLACLALAVLRAMSFAESMQSGGESPLDVHVVAALVVAAFLAILLVALRWWGPIAHANWVAVGALTYPLYLLHQVIGVTMFRAWGSAVNRHLLFWGVISLMICAAWLVNRQVENRYMPRIKTLLAGLGRNRSPATADGTQTR